ncbi:TPA: ash family protein [Salmonella enterica subsp. enterica serovar Thompson]
MVRTGNKNTMAQRVESVNGQNSVIILLRRREYAGYSFQVAAKSATGRGNPCYISATSDALSVFFIVAASVHLYSAVLIRTESMVAQAGLTSVRPVFDMAGISTPVWATTNQERGNSGGSKYSYISEIDACQRPIPKLTRNMSGFFWPFAVLICEINLIADKLQLLIIKLHVALLRVILWLPLQVVCHQERSPINSGPEIRQ